MVLLAMTKPYIRQSAPDEVESSLMLFQERYRARLSGDGESINWLAEEDQMESVNFQDIVVSPKRGMLTPLKRDRRLSPTCINSGWMNVLLNKGGSCESKGR